MSTADRQTDLGNVVPSFWLSGIFGLGATILLILAWTGDSGALALGAVGNFLLAAWWLMQGRIRLRRRSQLMLLKEAARQARLHEISDSESHRPRQDDT